MFVRTNNDVFIAIRRIARMVQRENKLDSWDWVFFDDEGNELGRINGNIFDPDTLSCAYVAAPGIVATIIYWSEDEVWTRRMPVAAWRINPNDVYRCAEPVFLEENGRNSMAVIEMPDGAFISPNDSHYETLDAAIAEAKRQQEKDNALRARI